MYNIFVKPLIRSIFKLKKTSSKRKKATVIESKAPTLTYESFTISNFKGIEKVTINLVQNRMVLLLGLNESGKTTILKAIESFDFSNDPSEDYRPRHFQNIRKKSDVHSNRDAIITAKINLDQSLELRNIKKIARENLAKGDREELEHFIDQINASKTITVSRVFLFKNGVPAGYSYRLETEHRFGSNPLAKDVAAELVNLSPFIIYFEDFKDMIPEKIYINKKQKIGFDPIWYDIINGLFYNTDEGIDVESFRRYHDPQNPRQDDANTVLTRVNQTLNNTFTVKWKNLSGVKEIDDTELIYNHDRTQPYFTLKVKDRDGTTYSVEERSKGALWYLSFLMKTEFRSKKLRKSSGKPIFLIDEPASNLHSTAQVNMISDFKKLAKESAIIYSTHSQYLISKSNIKDTYIIQRNGEIIADKWGDYLNKRKQSVTYYQPLMNVLNIVPNHFDIPWQKAWITEGPSDRHVLFAMYHIIFNKAPDCVIYPGTSASNLSDLISLNIGWNAEFKVLLDSDKEGKAQMLRYKKEFNLESEVTVLPLDNYTIEKYFEKKEVINFYEIVLGEKKQKITKKEFHAIFAILCENKQLIKKVSKELGEKTLDRFKQLFRLIEF